MTGRFLVTPTYPYDSSVLADTFHSFITKGTERERSTIASAVRDAIFCTSRKSFFAVVTSPSGILSTATRNVTPLDRRARMFPVVVGLICPFGLQQPSDVIALFATRLTSPMIPIGTRVEPGVFFYATTRKGFSELAHLLLDQSGADCPVMLYDYAECGLPTPASSLFVFRYNENCASQDRIMEAVALELEAGENHRYLMENPLDMFNMDLNRVLVVLETKTTRLKKLRALNIEGLEPTPDVESSSSSSPMDQIVLRDIETQLGSNTQIHFHLQGDDYVFCSAEDIPPTHRPEVVSHLRQMFGHHIMIYNAEHRYFRILFSVPRSLLKALIPGECLKMKQTAYRVVFLPHPMKNMSNITIYMVSESPRALEGIALRSPYNMLQFSFLEPQKHIGVLTTHNRFIASKFIAEYNGKPIGDCFIYPAHPLRISCVTSPRDWKPVENPALLYAPPVHYQTEDMSVSTYYCRPLSLSLYNSVYSQIFTDLQSGPGEFNLFSDIFFFTIETKKSRFQSIDNIFDAIGEHDISIVDKVSPFIIQIYTTSLLSIMTLIQRISKLFPFPIQILPDHPVVLQIRTISFDYYDKLDLLDSHIASQLGLEYYQQNHIAKDKDTIYVQIPRHEAPKINVTRPIPLASGSLMFSDPRETRGESVRFFVSLIAELWKSKSLSENSELKGYPWDSSLVRRIIDNQQHEGHSPENFKEMITYFAFVRSLTTIHKDVYISSSGTLCKVKKTSLEVIEIAVRPDMEKGTHVGSIQLQRWSAFPILSNLHTEKKKIGILDLGGFPEPHEIFASEGFLQELLSVSNLSHVFSDCKNLADAKKKVAEINKISLGGSISKVCVSIFRGDINDGYRYLDDKIDAVLVLSRLSITSVSGRGDPKTLGLILSREKVEFMMYELIKSGCTHILLTGIHDRITQVPHNLEFILESLRSYYHHFEEIYVFCENINALRECNSLIDAISPTYNSRSTAPYTSFYENNPLKRGGSNRRTFDFYDREYILPECSENQNCSLLENTTHSTIFEHRIPCSKGGLCTDIKEDGDHRELYLHPVVCPNETTCNIEDNGHAMMFWHRQKCHNGPVCQDLASVPHNTKFRHLKQRCPYGTFCSYFSNNLHMQTHTHPFHPVCPNLQNCKELASPLHRSQYAHYCENGPGCDKLRDMDHISTHIHACLPKCGNPSTCLSLKYDIHHGDQFDHGVGKRRKICPQASNCTDFSFKHFSEFTHSHPSIPRSTFDGVSFIYENVVQMKDKQGASPSSLPNSPIDPLLLEIIEGCRPILYVNRDLLDVLLVFQSFSIIKQLERHTSIADWDIVEDFVVLSQLINKFCPQDTHRLWDMIKRFMNSCLPFRITSVSNPIHTKGPLAYESEFSLLVDYLDKANIPFEITEMIKELVIFFTDLMRRIFSNKEAFDFSSLFCKLHSPISDRDATIIFKKEYILHPSANILFPRSGEKIDGKQSHLLSSISRNLGYHIADYYIACRPALRAPNLTKEHMLKEISYINDEKAILCPLNTSVSWSYIDELILPQDFTTDLSPMKAILWKSAAASFNVRIAGQAFDYNSSICHSSATHLRSPSIQHGLCFKSTQPEERLEVVRSDTTQRFFMEFGTAGGNFVIFLEGSQPHEHGSNVMTLAIDISESITLSLMSNAPSDFSTPIKSKDVVFMSKDFGLFLDRTSMVTYVLDIDRGTISFSFGRASYQYNKKALRYKTQWTDCMTKVSLMLLTPGTVVSGLALGPSQSCHILENIPYELVKLQHENLRPVGTPSSQTATSPSPSLSPPLPSASPNPQPIAHLKGTPAVSKDPKDSIPNCPDSDSCSLYGDEGHRRSFKHSYKPLCPKVESCLDQFVKGHPHVTEYCHPCRFGSGCRDIKTASHCLEFYHEKQSVCPKGSGCDRLQDRVHRRTHMHENLAAIMIPCKEGRKCMNKTLNHLLVYCHG